MFSQCNSHLQLMEYHAYQPFQINLQSLQRLLQSLIRMFKLEKLHISLFHPILILNFAM
jgi:hypothetical protein